MAIIDYFKQLFNGKNFARVILALIWTSAGIWIVIYLITHDLTGSMKEFGNTIIGYVMGVISTIVSFYFGSSQGSAEKDELLKQKTENKPL